MFNIEVKFKIQEREIPWDRFASAFLAEALRSSFEGIRSNPICVPQPASPQSAESRIPMAEPRVVNINEAARLLGIRVATVRAYVSRREISSVRIGRRVLIPTEVINELITTGLRPARRPIR
jgi:excisionase family DNA binding protein